MENLTINAGNSKEKYPLMRGNKSFGSKYLIDTDGTIWGVGTDIEVPWQRETIADLSRGSQDRAADAGKRKFSKLLADDGSMVTVGKAEALAWSIPEIVANHKPGTVVVFLDGNMANETAANLTWGTTYDMLARTRANSPGKSGGNSNQILSDEDVREILASFNPHDQGNNSRAMADRFGVAQTTINNVVVNKTFPHVDRKPFASNPHIKQERYFDSYVPGKGTILYKRYVEIGKIKPNTPAAESCTQAKVTNSSTEADITAVENKEESNHVGL